jgi:hypothetical protein
MHDTSTGPRPLNTLLSMSNARKYPPPSVKMLYGRAAGRCAFPGCRKEVVLDPTPADGQKQIGKIAHIVAHSDSGPRGDPTYPRHKLDTYENWVLLCPTCHDTVDALSSTYSVSSLRDLKACHEEWVSQQLNTQIPNVGFAELELVAKAIAQNGAAENKDLNLTPPTEKIRKNGLTGSSQLMITMGLSKAKEVGQYVEHISQVDADFPERLIAGFKNQYSRLKAAGATGDRLFDELREFAGGPPQDFARQAAGLVVLSYLFECCDVFEK